MESFMPGLMSLSFSCIILIEGSKFGINKIKVCIHAPLCQMFDLVLLMEWSLPWPPSVYYKLMYFKFKNGNRYINLKLLFKAIICFWEM